MFIDENLISSGTHLGGAVILRGHRFVSDLIRAEFEEVLSIALANVSARGDDGSQQLSLSVPPKTFLRAIDAQVCNASL